MKLLSISLISFISVLAYAGDNSTEIRTKGSSSLIHIDQIGDRGGWGFGMSSLEAMSMGLCCMTQIDKCAPYIKNHPFIEKKSYF